MEINTKVQNLHKAQSGTWKDQFKSKADRRKIININENSGAFYKNHPDEQRTQINMDITPQIKIRRTNTEPLPPNEATNKRI